MNNKNKIFMVKKITAPILFILISFICFSAPAKAENARSILDKTAGKLKGSGGLQATFEATSYKGSAISGNTSGTISVKGNKFKITSQQMTTWFDGKTQWSLMAGSDEAYVSTPTAAELQSINPYSFVNLYKKGYNLQMSTTDYNGKSCYEIRLTAQQKSSSISEMRIVIDKMSYWPLSVRVKQRGNWVRIRVGGISSGKNWDDKFFRFNKTDFPDVEIIDLR